MSRIHQPWQLLVGICAGWNNEHQKPRSLMQIAKKPTDPDDGFLSHTRFLIVDRDSKYALSFRTVRDNATCPLYPSDGILPSTYDLGRGPQ